MKKSVMLGLGIGVLFSVLIVVIYLVSVVAHNKNSTPEEFVKTSQAVVESESTTVEYMEESTQITESTVEPESETEQELGFEITYGDASVKLFLPEDKLSNYEDFMAIDGVDTMLGSLLFDVAAEWDASTFKNDNGVITFRGDITTGGYVEVKVDTWQCTGSADIHVPTEVPQTRDDFTRPGSNPVHTYAPGSSLSDVVYDTVTTQEINLREFVDYDEFQAVDYDGVPDTFDVVLGRDDFGQSAKSSLVYFIRRFFGPGEILVWDYEKLENSVTIFYCSINGWNVAVQVGGNDPYVLYTTAEPSRAPLLGQ